MQFQILLITTIFFCLAKADTVTFTKLPLVTFTKSDLADWELSQNQDSITSNVRITRKNNQGIFNIAQEDGYSNSNGSPIRTLWADTVTAAVNTSSYTDFKSMHGGDTQSIINDTVSLYLPDDGFRFDVK